MDTALKSVPDIIKAASATNLGIVALLILVTALLGVYFFRKAPVVYQFSVFLLTFLGAAAFAFAAIRVQQDDAAQVQADAIRKIQEDYANKIPDLQLTLLYSGNDVANPQRATVVAYVQKKSTGKREPRPDIVSHPGPGGIYLEFTQLEVGDILSVEVQDHGKKWSSYDLPMLSANLQMNLEEQ
jgi:hypothetical protein